MGAARSICVSCGKAKPRPFTVIYDEAKKVCKGLIPPYSFEHQQTLHGRLVALALEIEGWCAACSMRGVLAGARNAHPQQLPETGG
jgi:hypothetical protein